MSPSKKIYLSEFAVNLFSARWIITSANQLMSDGEMGEQEQEIAKNSHIYLICKTPSISFSEESFCYRDGNLSGHLNYKVNGNIREEWFSFEFPLLDDAVRVNLSKYPHREFSTYNANGDVVRYLPASVVSMMMGWHLRNNELSDLEVLYVGQAYGDGNRSAFDRLKSHSTLQKILAQANHDSPECEIVVLTFEYAPYRVIGQMDGRAKDVISDYRDIERFRNIINTPLTEYQQICLIEASLIRYFKPHYNSIYKDNFPNGKHKILESCYDLDFSGLIVEIDTEDLGYFLFSENVKAKSHHICKIDILDPEKRWGFFHCSNSDGRVFKMPEVIQRAPKC